METNEQKICPDCGAEMKMRNGKFGKFWGCTNYPDCRKIINIQRILPPKQENNIAKAQERKNEYITEHQEQKDESMKVLNAKNGGGAIVVALIEKGFIHSKDIESSFKKYTEYIYNFRPRTLNDDDREFENIENAF